MLTSEKAALAKVEQIYNELKAKNNKHYIDPHFGPDPNKKIDYNGHNCCLYKTGEVPQKGYVEPDDIEWVFAEELSKETPQFIDNKPTTDDCKQGEIGDCWFISALSVLVERDELLRGGRDGMDLYPEMIVDKEIATLLSNGVYPPIFHKYRSHGIFVMRFFKNFKWIYVIIDERIPVKKAD